VTETSMERKVFLCAAWIGAALLIGGLLWFFTQPYRTRLLIEAANKNLAAGGRLERQSRFFSSPASVMGGS
jgi:hypothetical protein